MSLLARVIRQFHESTEAVRLERVVALPHQPTMGTKLDLRAFGVEDALEVVAVTVRAHRDGPGFHQADVELYMSPEPLNTAWLAREGCWRDSQQV